MRIFAPVAFLSAMAFSGAALAAPVISQTGNLLTNGNFEAGSTTPVSSTSGVQAISALSSWKQFANSAPGTTSTWSISPLVDGDHAAGIAGGLNNGLFQYQSLAGGVYTMSGWIWVDIGTAALGIAWNDGSNAAFSTAASAKGQWQYLTLTQSITASTGGALAYSRGAGSSFYVDGLWLNAGSSSTSAYDPRTGFNPNASVPEPGSLALVGLALVALRVRRRL